MRGNPPMFPRLRPGDRLSAEFVNDITGSLGRISLFADQVNGIATSAGVHRRPDDDSPRLRTFQLTDTLTRTTSASANRMAFDGTEWVDQGEVVSIYGDVFRGFGFAADLIEALYHPVAARWLALGTGHTFVRGKIGNAPGGGTTELLSGGSAPFNVWTWDEDLGDWAETDPLQILTVHEAIGLDAPLPTGHLLFATWHEQAQLWIASQSPCPA